MQRFEQAIYERVERIPPYWLVGSATILTLGQFALAFFFHGPNSASLELPGWICLWSASIFGVAPILTFRKHGGVKQGESYIATTRLVTRGVYAIVRHPQNGTSWILINLGLALIVRHWSSALTGGLSMLLAYLDTYQADQRCLQKFGDSYHDYMARVPRVNFLYGLVLWVRQRLANHNE